MNSKSKKELKSKNKQLKRKIRKLKRNTRIKTYPKLLNFTLTYSK